MKQRDASPAGPSRLVIGAATSTTVLAIALALVVLLLPQRSAAVEQGAGVIAAAGHGGHGAAPGTSMAAAMVGEDVAAPGDANATDQFLDLPPAQPYSAGRVREFTLIAEEHDIEVAAGVHYPAWTFRLPGQPATVPGPTLRVTEGDLVRITLRNRTRQPHTLHTHGIHASDQDGVFEMVEPGDERTYEFVAGPSGVQPYHCHAMPLKKHIGKGMYGMLIIDPKQPPAERADREISMVMNGFDTDVNDENDVYTVNGLAFHYAKYPIRVRRGELVRIYLENMTEHDALNSFHVHGNFFQYRPIGFENPPQYTDLVTQVQGDRGIIDIRFPTVGKYMFHAHQTEFGDLGWMGFFEVVA